MYANVFDGPGLRSWKSVPDAVLASPTDVVIRVDATTICGTDLHILKGDVPEVSPGTVLGHEAVGTVVSVGDAVETLEVGDRVLASCISSCGRCRFCREGRYGQCRGGGGWILGHTTDGVHSELSRIPFADNSTHLIPAGVTDEQMLMLADILPTSYEVGVLNGAVRPGDVVAIVGAGPIGLAAVQTSQLYSPSTIIAIDVSPSRLDAAKSLGADVVINSRDEDPRTLIDSLTGGLGVDVSMEAVGLPETFELAVELVRPGGHVANIGVHGKPVQLHLEKIWIDDLTITTGLVDTTSTPALIRLLASGRIDPSDIVTHRFELHEMDLAWEVFAGAADSGALKVVLSSKV